MRQVSHKEWEGFLRGANIALVKRLVEVRPLRVTYEWRDATNIAHARVVRLSASAGDSRVSDTIYEIDDETRKVVDDLYNGESGTDESADEIALDRMSALREKNRETQKSPEQQLLEEISEIIGGLKLANRWWSTWEKEIEEVQTLLKTHGFIEEKGRDRLG